MNGSQGDNKNQGLRSQDDEGRHLFRRIHVICTDDHIVPKQPPDLKPELTRVSPTDSSTPKLNQLPLTEREDYMKVDQEATKQHPQPPPDTRPELFPGSASELDNQDPVVFVIGQAGAGKSSFINAAAGSTLAVGHGLYCCTKKLQSVTTAWRGRKIVFVDTPAFDIDINVNAEANFKRKIEKWRRKSSTQNHVVVGIIYLHKISETRLTEPPHKRLKTFSRLWGGSLPENVILVTTMWNEVPPDEGRIREDEIRANYWKSTATDEPLMARFEAENDSSQAWRAVELLLEASRRRS